jgi:DNA-binding response OmpR family regulator
MSSKLLIIEDDDPIRVLVSRIATRCGFEVDLARDGSEGLALLRDGEYDKVILDLMMPGVSGFHVLEQLRQLRPGKLHCIMIMTAVTDATLATLDTTLVHQVIRKPFDIHELAVQIQECARCDTLQPQRIEQAEGNR